MNETMQKTLQALKYPAAATNLGREERAGVLFNTYTDHDGRLQDEAYVIGSPRGSEPSSYSQESASLIMRLSEWGIMDFPEEKPFYSYCSKAFRTSPSKITIPMIHDKINSGKNSMPIRLDVNAVINWITKVCEGKPERANFERLVIKNNPGLPPKRGGYVNIRFDDQMQYKKGDLIFEPTNTGKIQRSLVKPGKLYVCKFSSSNGNYVYLDVLSPYFKGIELGAWESKPGIGYFPRTPLDVFDFFNYPDGRIFKCPNLIGDVDYKFYPIHLDMNAFMTIMNMYIGFRFVDMIIDPEVLSPVYFASVKESEDMPMIEAWLAPLNQDVRGDVR